MPAYKERPIFDGRVYANVSCSGVTGSMLDGWARSWYTSITSAWTAQSGFSISLSSDCYQEATVKWFTWNWTFEYNFSYTVKSNTTGEVVSGNSIYTLSPLMINGYRLACGSRPAAKHLILPLEWDGGIGEQGGMYATGINIAFSDPYVTDQDGKKLSGFTTSVTGLNEVHEIILGAYFYKTYSFSGTAKVLYNNQIILQSDYAFDVNLSLSLGFGPVQHETRQLI